MHLLTNEDLMFQMISVKKTSEYFDNRCGQEHLQVRDLKNCIEILKERTNIKTSIVIIIIGPRERSERGLTKPLLPPTGAPRFATENHHF